MGLKKGFKTLYNKFDVLNDKVKHVIVGTVFGMSYYFVLLFIYNINTSIIISLIYSSVVFIGKEVYDKYKKYPTGFDWEDIYADYIGWCFGVFIVSFIQEFINIFTF